MYYLSTGAWVAVILVNWINGNRKTSVILGILGTIAQIGVWAGVGANGYWSLAVLIVLTVIGMFSAPDIFLRRG